LSLAPLFDLPASNFGFTHVHKCADNISELISTHEVGARRKEKMSKKERIYDGAEEKGQKRIYIFRQAASLDVISC
jgi:hypothetical protein